MAFGTVTMATLLMCVISVLGVNGDRSVSIDVKNPSMCEDATKLVTMLGNCICGSTSTCSRQQVMALTKAINSTAQTITIKCKYSRRTKLWNCTFDKKKVSNTCCEENKCKNEMLSSMATCKNVDESTESSFRPISESVTSTNDPVKSSRDSGKLVGGVVGGLVGGVIITVVVVIIIWRCVLARKRRQTTESEANKIEYNSDKNKTKTSTVPDVVGTALVKTTSNVYEVIPGDTDRQHGRPTRPEGGTNYDEYTEIPEGVIAGQRVAYTASSGDTPLEEDYNTLQLGAKPTSVSPGDYNTLGTSPEQAPTSEYFVLETGDPNSGCQYELASGPTENTGTGIDSPLDEDYNKLKRGAKPTALSSGQAPTSEYFVLETGDLNSGGQYELASGPTENPGTGNDSPLNEDYNLLQRGAKPTTISSGQALTSEYFVLETGDPNSGDQYDLVSGPTENPGTGNDSPLDEDYNLLQRGAKPTAVSPGEYDTLGTAP